jgi:hypothetical protein
MAAVTLLIAQYREVSDNWTYMLRQPDQRATLSALHRMGKVARECGITREQLARVVAPALRAWNGSVMTDCPTAFPLMKLVQAPEHVDLPVTDESARTLITERLRQQDRMALGMGACASFAEVRLPQEPHTLAVAEPVLLDRVSEITPGRFRSERNPGLIKYEFVRTDGASFLVLPGLQTNQELEILWCDGAGRWRPSQFVRWLPSANAVQPALIDLRTMIHLWGEPITQIAIRFTHPGEITLASPPRLLR